MLSCYYCDVVRTHLSLCCVAEKKGIERLREAKMMLQEGFIEQAEFDEVKAAVLAQMKG